MRMEAAPCLISAAADEVDLRGASAQAGAIRVKLPRLRALAHEHQPERRVRSWRHLESDHENSRMDGPSTDD